MAVTVWRVLSGTLQDVFLLGFSNVFFSFFFSHDESVLGRKSTEVKCHFHLIILRRHTIKVIAVDFDHRVEVAYGRRFLYEVVLLSCPGYYTLWKRVTAQPLFKE